MLTNILLLTVFLGLSDCLTIKNSNHQNLRAQDQGSLLSYLDPIRSLSPENHDQKYFFMEAHLEEADKSVKSSTASKISQKKEDLSEDSEESQESEESEGSEDSEDSEDSQDSEDSESSESSEESEHLKENQESENKKSSKQKQLRQKAKEEQGLFDRKENEKQKDSKSGKVLSINSNTSVPKQANISSVNVTKTIVVENTTNVAGLEKQTNVTQIKETKQNKSNTPVTFSSDKGSNVSDASEDKNSKILITEIKEKVVNQTNSSKNPNKTIVTQNTTKIQTKFVDNNTKQVNITNQSVVQTVNATNSSNITKNKTENLTTNVTNSTVNTTKNTLEQNSTAILAPIFQRGTQSGTKPEVAFGCYKNDTELQRDSCHQLVECENIWNEYKKSCEKAGYKMVVADLSKAYRHKIESSNSKKDK